MAIDLKEIGNRLFKIRTVIGMGARGGQKAFGTKLGAEEGQYSVWERGDGMIPVTYADKLIDLFPDVTLDYIYRGDFRGVGIVFAEALRATGVRGASAGKGARTSAASKGAVVRRLPRKAAKRLQ